MQQHIQYYRMAALCEALVVSPSGYYAWLRRPINTYKLALKEAVNRCYVTHQARVGAPSMTAELKAQGFTMSVRTISCNTWVCVLKVADNSNARQMLITSSVRRLMV